jgi:predicted N-acetyltransferase YhbS
MDLHEDVGDGLELRRATAADVEALVAFNGEMHGGPEGPDPYIAEQVRNLMAGEHPSASAGDFTVVVNQGGDIVSSLVLLAEPWVYDGVPLAVGRIEFVATHPDYRRRGLVRRQMEVAHRWCAERGFPVQAISGIPNYYRRFGYEMALELWGGRAMYPSSVPALADGTEEPFRVRPAVEGDVPFLASVDEQTRGRWLMAAVRDEGLWRHMLTDPREERHRPVLRIIERPDGQPVGYLAHRGGPIQHSLIVDSYELARGMSWFDVTPSVLRYLKTTGEALRKQDKPDSFSGIFFAFGTEHPMYRAIPDRLPRIREPYAWYMRVPDLPNFLRRISSVLESRLAASVAPGYTGELLLNFYEDGLRLTLANGRLETVEAWTPDHPEDGDALFPGLSFLQLLFGRRSLSELEHAAVDCRAVAEKARVLLDAMFPKRPSSVWPLVC